MDSCMFFTSLSSLPFPFIHLLNYLFYDHLTCTQVSLQDVVGLLASPGSAGETTTSQSDIKMINEP